MGKRVAEFYEPYWVLSMMDIDGKRPETYAVEGNRTGGKTFGFKTVIMNDFDKRENKFVILRRQVKQLQGVADYFSFDIFKANPRLGRFKLTQHSKVKDTLYELRYGGAPCGYVMPLAAAQWSKEASSLFGDIHNIFFDEFQAKRDKYEPGEYESFETIKGSIARGGGEHARYVRTLMCSNQISIFNPYYIAWGVTDRLDRRSKIIRGKGWVLERNYNPKAAHAYAEAHRQTEGTAALDSSLGKRYLIENNAFVSKMPGQKLLLCVMKSGERMYGVWRAGNDIYVSRQYDPSFPLVITLDIADHGEGDVYMGKATGISRQLDTAYRNGRIYFDSAESRLAYIKGNSMLKSAMFA